MRKTFLAVLLICVASVSLAQTPNDFSTYFKVTKSSTAKIPWYTYSQGTRFLDVRYNFDYANATTVFVGRNWQHGNTTWTPEIGAVVGDGRNGATVEILSYTEKGSFSLFTLNQVCAGLNTKSPDFAYHDFSALYKVNDWLKIGGDGQVYWESSTKADLDIGPTVKVSADGFYLKLWWSVNPTQGPQKTFVGVGKVF